MSTAYLSESLPQAPGERFDFEGRAWEMVPVDTLGVLEQLERWCVRHARASVERLRPPSDRRPDPAEVSAYVEDLDAYRDRLAAGWFRYGAAGFDLLTSGGEGLKRCLLECVRHRCPEWTEAHVERLLADPAAAQAALQLYRDVNDPKRKAPPAPTRSGAAAGPGSIGRPPS